MSVVQVARLGAAALALALAGCGERGIADASTFDVPDTPGASGDSGTPSAWFEEVARERGLVFEHRSGHAGPYLMPEAVCGGAALFDADDDGDLDAYLVQAGSLAGDVPSPPNQLFRNDGRGYFDDVSRTSGTDHRGYGMGAACGDADGDGDTDLYVTNLGANVLFENAGGLVFEDVTAASGTGDGRFGASAAFLDYDEDGLLDLFVANYVDWYATAELDCRDAMGLPDYCGPLNYDAPSRDVLFHNVGQGRFDDVSTASGIDAARGNGLGVVCADFDGDGWTDVFVANDGTPNHLWRNGGDGTFRDVALVAGCALDLEGIAKAGMGVAVGDVDDDADPDLLVCNQSRESDSFFLNDAGRFRDRSSSAGLRVVSRPFTRFGLGLVDFDNDGRLDLYEANGRVERQSQRYGPDPFAEPNLVLAGRPGVRFEEVLPRGGTSALLAATSRAAAFGDVDGDGGVDVLVVNRDGPAHLLLNRVPNRGRWVAFRLREDGREALHATVSIDVAGRRVRREARSAYSYLAASTTLVHFGLGAIDEARNVRVRWLDGIEESFGDRSAGHVHVLERRRSH
jgi:hypothetical protein